MLPVGVVPFLEMVNKVMAEKCLVTVEFVPAGGMYEIEKHRRTAVEEL